MTRTARIAAYRQRLQERISRVDEDVAYRFARAQAQVAAAAREREWADLLAMSPPLTRGQADAAADAELGARIGISPGRRADQAQTVREQSLDEMRLK